MDELKNSAHQVKDYAKVHLNMAVDGGIKIIRQYSDEGKNLASRAINDSSLDGIRSTLHDAGLNLTRNLGRLKSLLGDIFDPEIIYEQFGILFRDEITRNNAYFICVGIGLGTTGGFLLGLCLARPRIQSQFMKAIACVSYRDFDNVTICNTPVPYLINSTDVLVKVRAVSIHRIDERISRGYGRTLRTLIQNYSNSINPEFPLIIGRSCAGIVEAVGNNAKSGLEIGDEVWLASQWYDIGLASEFVVAPEYRISRKPYIIGFEGAASIPYSGCVALDALKKAGLNEHTCKEKRILIQEGCSPVGCVISQLTKKWGAHVAATCFFKSAPVSTALGVDDIIALQNDSDSVLMDETDPITNRNDNLTNELKKREKYDVIFVTTAQDYNFKILEQFLNPEGGLLVNTIESDILSDQYGFFTRIIYSILIRFKKLGMTVFRIQPNWGGPHLCHMALDRLAGYVNEGILQTVVDSVFTPQDAERAVVHISSEKAIGNTIVTFR